MPYSFYQFAKIMGLVGFGVLLYFYFTRRWVIETCIAAAGVVLFNPFFKISFARDTWQIVDLWIAIICGAWIGMDIIRGFLQNRSH